MLVISSREFREKQKLYLDLVDKNEQVIVQRGKNKAYALIPITETDRYFADPAVKARLSHSLAQATKGELTTLPKEDINKFLGL
jgi:antitoxin YefM